ncbi:MAG: hypothetical protein CMI53_04845 [Parcubacteria group bacterium]|jgi:hypothetical protein|nr:hypothetical protein [Parcubacteria group bacterium]|tara:strand:- start:20048 stop:20377 length:330 start_codon:yes stop_codon:yes gene_type:complete
MKLTLVHQATQEAAIKIIDDKLNELLEQQHEGIEVSDSVKEWDDNIMRFSFSVQKLLFTLEFSGNLIVTDEEAILEGDLPGLLLTFVSEDKVKEILTEEFNKLFNIESK